MEKPKTRGPSLEKTQETRKKIIDSALHHFIDVGFARAKISEIAKGAELGKGTIYSYFETKEQLFEGVIDALINESFRPIQAKEITEDESVYAFICKKIIPSVFTLEPTGRADMARLILREGNNFPHIRQTYVSKIFLPIQRELEILTLLAITRGELSLQISPQQFALLIVSPMWMSMIHNGILSPDGCLPMVELFQENLKILFGQS
ncbi:TetR/AcrR family transcriptional regulator [Acinetobacter ursingii]|uniref:TetR/AcrR family transcriptional regulator n=1 Tax=Acinetobacter ursingii TaxID=108980 RepID=UPI00124C9FAF|nr:TetR/AcrR family transcriptional regulator [Acinetobacter ursingii]MCU4350140.1 TetR/AcrR family transcriptional regulator [Acinetobacter ursingii]MDI3238031.1 TetR/AcrR family transcriptional regulator [Acinetobacter ursingii]